MAISKITKEKNEGKYRVRIQPVDEVTGKVISVPSKIANTKTEAKKIERLMWGEFEKKGFNPTIEAPFAEEFASYCKDEMASGRWSYPMYKDWSYTSRLVSTFFGKAKIKDVNENLVRDFARNYIATHKNAAVSKSSTIDRRLTHLRQYFEVLKEQGKIKINPVPKGALKKFFRYDEFVVTDEKYIFSDEEVAKIKARMINRLTTLPTSYWASRIGLLIALDTGMRPQEIQAVKWSQLIDDGEFKVFQINDSWSEKTHGLNGHLKGRPKGYVRKTLPLDNDTLEILKVFHKRQKEFLANKGLINKNDYVVLNLRDSRLTALGTPIGQASMNLIIKKVAKEVGVNNNDKQISCYNCRHTVASKWANTSGVALSFLAFRLGHSVQQLLKTYVHEDNERSQNMMKLMYKDEPKSQQKLNTL